LSRVLFRERETGRRRVGFKKRKRSRGITRGVAAFPGTSVEQYDCASGAVSYGTL
jgi:hypothetical protein